MLAVLWQAALIVFALLACGVLFTVGLVNPRRSRWSQLQLDRLLRRGERAGRKADERRPGSSGRLLEKPFAYARAAAAKSTALGRKARSKLPV